MRDGTRKGFCCFLFRIANRRRTAAGTRRIHVPSNPLMDYPAVVRGSSRLPRFYGDSGTGKIGRQEQPGEPTQNAGLANSGTCEL
jgi:hypothetical protein